MISKYQSETIKRQTAIRNDQAKNTDHKIKLQTPIKNDQAKNTDHKNKLQIPIRNDQTTNIDQNNQTTNTDKKAKEKYRTNRKKTKPDPCSRT